MTTAEVISVRTAILTPKLDVLLLKRASWDDFRNDMWDLPGGGPEDNETRLQTAVREAEEESGIILNPVQMIPVELENSITRKPDVTITRFLFRTAIQGQTPVTLRPPEHSAYAWVPLRESASQLDHEIYSPALERLAIQLYT